MSQKYEKLKNLLKELFQLAQPDLDFGLYRIMHARSKEIIRFPLKPWVLRTHLFMGGCTWVRLVGKWGK